MICNYMFPKKKKTLKDNYEQVPHNSSANSSVFSSGSFKFLSFHTRDNYEQVPKQNFQSRLESSEVSNMCYPKTVITAINVYCSDFLRITCLEKW